MSGLAIICNLFSFHKVSQPDTTTVACLAFFIDRIPLLVIPLVNLAIILQATSL